MIYIPVDIIVSDIVVVAVRVNVCLPSYTTLHEAYNVMRTISAARVVREMKEVCVVTTVLTWATDSGVLEDETAANLEIRICASRSPGSTIICTSTSSVRC